MQTCLIKFAIWSLMINFSIFQRWKYILSSIQHVITSCMSHFVSHIWYVSAAFTTSNVTHSCLRCQYHHECKSILQCNIAEHLCLNTQSVKASSLGVWTLGFSLPLRPGELEWEILLILIKCSHYLDTECCGYKRLQVAFGVIWHTLSPKYMADLSDFLLQQIPVG